MKKLFFVAAALFCIGCLSSCKKDWTCTCTVQGASAPYICPINGLTKSDATTDCNNKANVARITTGSTGTASCSI